ncbi:MAG: nicotinate (nicotinamide) nucleotide adenylyltransferase [Treponema sp.]|nr:nicotinate (nicotinamide) nucleotide adenylyltransferase [Treponema sp.]MBR6912869.1 nicotinate (nicotinamide) nucleotide adenylyltransferase [Treponema sp.]MCR5123929.1 nicotinate (nicotinamide) nucleotide adenylyltransferase [Treponema sp.]
MKIAILGGSYNPIHIGHLILADSVCTELGYDKILFVPTFKPPHKELSDKVSSSDRLEMVRAAVRGDDRFVAESCEIDRGGISYTWDTVCFLEEKYKDVLTGKIGVIFGEDLLPDYDKWEHSAELAEKADLILACRPESSEDNGKFCNAPTEKYGKNPMVGVTRENFPYPHKIVMNPKMEISSSEIRRKIAERGAWRYLVAEGVFEYILEKKLYGI